MRALILRSLRYPGWSSLRRGQTLLYNSLCSPSRHLPAVSPLVSRRFLQVRAPLRTGQTTAARTTPAPEQTQWTLTVEELVERVRNAIWEGKSGSMWAFFPFFPLCVSRRDAFAFLKKLANLASRQSLDRRARNEEQQEAKRRKLEQGEQPFTPIYATNFSPEEIASEQRRPKKKVAVLMGYSGTGYHGMQLCVCPAS